MRLDILRTISCDVVVVGAGTAGSMAAKHCAIGGMDTIMIEKRAEIGAPLRCAEGVTKAWLEEAGIVPDGSFISQGIKGIIIRSKKGTSFRLETKPENGINAYVLNRHLFDKRLAMDAADAGARIMMRTSCTGVIREDGRIVGIRANSMGEETEIRAKVIVAADGYESQTARWAGMDTNLALSDISSCIQYRMCGLDIEPDICEFIVGSVAPGGYIWVFPKGDGEANVGIGVSAQFCRGRADVKGLLDDWIAGEPRFRNGQILELVGGMYSTCPGLDSAVDDNIVLVGDAARVIDPITGGGIMAACLTGLYAGQTLVECSERGDFSKDALQTYERRWRDRLEDGLFRDWMFKQKLDTLDDDSIDILIGTVRDIDLNDADLGKIVAAVKERVPQLFEGLDV